MQGAKQTQQSPVPQPQGMYWKRGGGAGSGTQKFVYQKWPKSICSSVIFFLPTMTPLLLWLSAILIHPW